MRRRITPEQLGALIALVEKATEISPEDRIQANRLYKLAVVRIKAHQDHLISCEAFERMAEEAARRIPGVQAAIARLRSKSPRPLTPQSFDAEVQHELDAQTAHLAAMEAKLAIFDSDIRRV